MAVLVIASVVLIFLILGLSWRKGWLHGEVAADKGTSSPTSSIR